MMVKLTWCTLIQKFLKLPQNYKTKQALCMAHIMVVYMSLLAVFWSHMKFAHAKMSTFFSFFHYFCQLFEVDDEHMDK